MKKIKKMAGLLLALVLVFSLDTAALASGMEPADNGTCSITIENSVTGNTYYAYKIFDATYSEDSDAVAYTMSADSAWKALILGEGEDYFTARAVYEDGFNAESDPYGEHVSYYTITRVETAGDSEIIGWLTGCITGYNKSTRAATLKDGSIVEPAAEGVDGNGGEATISGLDPGYYFVTTANTGSVVSVTTAAPDATIIDKNLTPGSLDKSIVVESPNGGGDKVDSDVHGMDEEVDFDVTAHVPLYDGDKVVTEYTFTDRLSNGILIELTEGQFITDTKDGKTIYLLDEELVNQWVTLGEEDTNFTAQVYDYTFELLGYDTYTDETTGETYHTFTGFVLTYFTYDTEAYDPEDDDPESTFDTSKYPVNADIEIRYSAHVTSLEGFDNTNDITMEWMVTSWNHPTPEDSRPGTGSGEKDHNDVYSWELELVKVDGDDKITPLEGATFTLSSNNMQSVVVGHSYAYVLVSKLEASTTGTVTVEDADYKVVNFETTDYYMLADGSFTVVSPLEADPGTEYDSDPGPYHRILTDKYTTVTETDHLAEGTTDSNGKLYFAGLGAGNYVLTEITPPGGYNILSGPIEFTISWDEAEGFTVTMNASGTTYSMSDHYVLTMTVENNQGSILPGTGGTGTTIFYIIGAVIVAGAVVLLVTRRRVNRAK